MSEFNCHICLSKLSLRQVSRPHMRPLLLQPHASRTFSEQTPYARTAARPISGGALLPDLPGKTSRATCARCRRGHRAHGRRREGQSVRTAQLKLRQVAKEMQEREEATAELLAALATEIGGPKKQLEGMDELHSGASLVITAEDGIAKIRAMFHELGIPREEGDRRTIVLGLPWRFEGPLAHETAYLCHCSGITSKPKTTHQNITTILDVIQPFFLRLGQRHRPQLYASIPDLPICALAILLHLPFTRFKILFVVIVPPVLVVLTRYPAAEKCDLSSLKYMLCGAALGAEVVKQVKGPAPGKAAAWCNNFARIWSH
ncbi:AMP binding protein [Mycena sanguinolenta]|uniref:AMP binding protein n=1 Tax=Mycena sanguinolenta TaxID=230812 RepID=A0A8H6U4C6_9AGAR|nr:AMP binding protein [Mycena sanguinolenta]